MSQALAEVAGFSVIRSDVVRKELASLASEESEPGGFGQGIYTQEWTERTYVECSRRARGLLFEGKRVIVDASFGSEATRSRFLELAIECGVPAILFLCQADPSVIRSRLETRRNDASDADWGIYQQAALLWEEPGPITKRSTQTIDSGEDKEHIIAKVLVTLGVAGLQA